MRITYHTHDGRLAAEFDCKDSVDLFEQIAHFQEIFDGLHFSRNGVEAKNIQLQVREHDGNKYYEAVVRDTNPEIRGYKRRFGLTKAGGLFPKATELSDGTKSHWIRWDREKGEEVGP